MASADRRPLIDLPRELLAAYGRPVPYATLWRLAVQGGIPVDRLGGRWLYDPADVPRIAAALGLAAGVAPPIPTAA